MSRAFILMLDSFGIGATQDAEKYHDSGADTLRHIAEYYLKKNKSDVHQGSLHIPNLIRLGINHAAKISQGAFITGFSTESPHGLYGCAEELSHGKDTQSGHWELAGVPVLRS